MAHITIFRDHDLRPAFATVEGAEGEDLNQLAEAVSEFIRWERVVFAFEQHTVEVR